MVFVMLFMAVGYGNNLIYIYVFALISVSMSSMYLTNKNVERVEIESLDVEIAYAQEDALVGVTLNNPSTQDSYQLDIYFLEREKPNQSVVTESLIAAQQKMTVPIKWKSSERGYVDLPRLILLSRFPFGILRAWKTFSSSEKILVYPSRTGMAQFPTSATSGNDQGNLGLFRDHRPYQSTDSPRRVDWRATAKYQNLLVKNFERAEQSALHLDWLQTSSLGDFETRLSQMSLWISQAHSLGLFYSLKILGFQTEMSHGLSHFRKCMEKLALLQPEDVG